MRPLSSFRCLATGILPLLLLAGCVYVPIEPGTHSQLPPPPPAPTPAPPPPVITKPLPPHPVEPFPAQPQVLIDVAFSIQTRLDRDNLSSGGIDGRWGLKSEKALAAWQRKNGMTPTGKIDDAIIAALGNTNDVLTTYTITESDHASLTPFPSFWLERSQQERMGYSTIEELLAEKFHVYRATLRRMNPAATWPNPPAGTAVLGPSIKSSPLPPLSKIEIRLEQKTLTAYDEKGNLAAQFPCSIAADKTKRPVGETLHVVVWAENPDYTFDPALFAEDPKAAAIGKKLRIPPGPNNPVGMAWIGLDRPGYGIHGTPSPEDISRTESHGCFRMTNWDALKLVKAVKNGLPVLVLP